jgi:hypothetical protein
MNDQQALVREFDCHHLQRDSVRVIAEIHESCFRFGRSAGRRRLLEPEATVLNDETRTVMGYPMFGRRAGPPQNHGDIQSVLSDNIAARLWRGRTAKPLPAPSAITLVGRYYDPSTGQFITVDPLVDQTGQPYAYTAGDPVNASDPNGMPAISYAAAERCMATASCRNAAYPWDALAQGASHLGTWISNNRGQALEFLASGICVAATPIVCLGALTVALVYNTVENSLSASSFSQFQTSEARTLIETALGGGAGLTLSGLGAFGLYDMEVGGPFFGAAAGSNWLPESFAGKALLNLPGSASSSLVTALEPSIASVASRI